MLHRPLSVYGGVCVCVCVCVCVNTVYTSECEIFPRTNSACPIHGYDIPARTPPPLSGGGHNQEMRINNLPCVVGTLDMLHRPLIVYGVV